MARGDKKRTRGTIRVVPAALGPNPLKLEPEGTVGVSSLSPNLSSLARAVGSQLSDDLLKPEWRTAERRSVRSGHCYAASEAFYHLAGGKAAGWTPQVIQHEGGSHWFLKRSDGTILDLTADQFASPVPYREARGAGFLTKLPSKRAQTLIDRCQLAGQLAGQLAA